MVDRWAIIEATLRFDDEVDDIERLMERVIDAVTATVCPHPETWSSSAPDLITDECRQMVVGSHLLVSPPERSEAECPFCGTGL